MPMTELMDEKSIEELLMQAGGFEPATEPVQRAEQEAFTLWLNSEVKQAYDSMPIEHRRQLRQSLTKIAEAGILLMQKSRS